MSNPSPATTMDGNFKENCQILGLGFVGLTLAVHLAQRSRVTGVEKNREVLSLLREGRPHFYEKNLDTLMEEAIRGGQLTFTEAPSFSAKACTYVITVGTPISERQINLSNLRKVASQVAEVAKDNDLVVVRSTVSVGSTAELVKSEFLKRNKETRVAFCPERTIEGRAMEELTTTPQIIGADDELSFEMARAFFEFHGSKVLKLSSTRAAELCKLANNSYRDLQFGFANQLASLSHALALSAREVIEAANFDYPRSNIQRPGLTGGPCLEKDPWILHQVAANSGVDFSTVSAGRVANEETPVEFLRSVLKKMPKAEKTFVVFIGGLAFKGKPETSDSRGSLAWPLIRTILSHEPDSKIFAVDPLVASVPEKFLGRVELLRQGLDKEALPTPDLVLVQNNNVAVTKELVGWLHEAEHTTVLDYWGDVAAALSPDLGHAIYEFGGF